ncbi:CTTNBP2 N-terminal like b isoform X2 [Denticeps clupeoides]|uniref:CTTNBP2 N-terminal like b isoform X2 n=1 Tax=Denticeps clupeoides TaxID=299321 RepID=UPI0010A42F78|nr:CTTNBP2 N-terminal-like protein isoform X2 [Denticeps clupeoides]
MKECRMNVESLSKPELLMLLSILEGELEAQDLVIHALRRDSEVVRQGQGPGQEGEDRASTGSPNPLAVLKLVMTHCKRMQEKMMAQLAAVESRHRRVIADLEEEKRRHAQDTAQGDDVTYMLEKEREKLLQQLEVEREQVQRLEHERQRQQGQAEEERAQQQHLSSTLAQECQRASARAQEQEQRAAELWRHLQEESGAAQALRAALEGERGRVRRAEAAAERHLAELDTEREQMGARLKKEEQRCRELQAQVEALRKEISERDAAKDKKEEKEKANVKLVSLKTSASTMVSTSSQTEVDGKSPLVTKTSVLSKLNGHHLTGREPEGPEEKPGQENGMDAAVAASPPSPAAPSAGSTPITTPLQSLSPSGTACSSLSSSPVSSPVLSKRLASLGASSPTYPSSYQASVNQRFQAARHKFQSQAEQELHPHSPRDLSPTTATTPLHENTAAKQLARNTVTQVLSRFTSQQAGGGKLTSHNSSPFGTDYRSLASSSSSSSPTTKSPSPLSPGLRSPIIPRLERGHPPPVPPKKAGTSQSPGSPVPSTRASHFPELSGSCGLTSTQEGSKEMDLVVSSSS